MLVTDVGNKISWWQFKDLSDRQKIFVTNFVTEKSPTYSLKYSDFVTNCLKLSSSTSHQHQKDWITRSKVLLETANCEFWIGLRVQKIFNLQSKYRTEYAVFYKNCSEGRKKIMTQLINVDPSFVQSSNAFVTMIWQSNKLYFFALDLVLFLRIFFSSFLWI